MSLFQAFILGLIQGVTEFLPISSSAHIQLISFLCNFQLEKESTLFFSILCNLGTVCSIVCVLNNDIKRILRNYKEINFHFILPSLPLVPIVFLRSSLKPLFDLKYFCFYFLVTAITLYYAERKAGILRSTKFAQTKANQALWIGLWQSIAIFPGISRSSMTISAARMLGWDLRAAVRYSFLLAIPTGLGAFVVEGLSLLHKNPYAYLTLQWSDMVGFFSSFGIGWLTLSLVFKIIQVKKISLLPFAFYCFLLAFGLGIYFYLL